MRKKLGIILAIILLFDIFAFAIVKINKNIAEEAPQQSESVTGAEESTTQELISKASFVAVGDNLIHNTVYEQARDRSSNGGYDFEYAYQHIASRIAEADVAILNQETVISESHEVSSYPQFNSPTEVGQEMIDIGFDVANIATNHSLDVGESGLIDHINYWKNKGIITTGAYLNEESFVVPTNTVNGITVAYLGFTAETNGLSLPSDSEVVLVGADDEALLSSKIDEAKKIADVVIVNAHWGVEYTHTPTEEQRIMAQKLADWGADIVIGTHPHVIQPVEYVTAKDGSKTLVAYSLGNFISAQNRGPRMLGGMLNFNLVKNNSTGEVNIEDVKFTGTVTHYGQGFTGIRVYSLDDYTQELAENHGVKNNTSDFSLEYLKAIVDEVIDKQFLVG